MSGLTTARSHPLLGTIIVEPDAARLLRDAGVQLWDCLRTHLDGDLGDTAVTGSVERAALWSEGRVRSSYPIGPSWIGVATDRSRGATTVTAAVDLGD